MPDGGKYDDILNAPRPASHMRQPMPAAERAAQFLPFKSLTGYEDDLAETARVTADRVELNEEEVLSIGEKLAFLAEHPDMHAVVRVVYYLPDMRKAGGAYREVSAGVRKVRLAEQELLLDMGVAIPFGDILSLEGDLFPPL